MMPSTVPPRVVQTMKTTRLGRLLGRVTTGHWNELDLPGPTILQPTWSSLNPDPASVDIIVEPTFIPTLYWVPDNARGNVDFGTAPSNQMGVLSNVHGPQLYLPGGKVWVCNPNPATLPVPYVLLDASDPVRAAQYLDQWAPGMNTGIRADNFTIATIPAAPTAIEVVGWDALRTRLIAANASAITYLLGVGNDTPGLAGGGLDVSRTSAVESPAPWSRHMVASTGAAINSLATINMVYAR